MTSLANLITEETAATKAALMAKYGPGWDNLISYEMTALRRWPSPGQGSLEPATEFRGLTQAIHYAPYINGVCAGFLYTDATADAILEFGYETYDRRGERRDHRLNAAIVAEFDLACLGRGKWLGGAGDGQYYLAEYGWDEMERVIWRAEEIRARSEARKLVGWLIGDRHYHPHRKEETPEYGRQMNPDAREWMHDIQEALERP